MLGVSFHEPIFLRLFFYLDLFFLLHVLNQMLLVLFLFLRMLVFVYYFVLFLFLHYQPHYHPHYQPQYHPHYQPQYHPLVFLLYLVLKTNRLHCLFLFARQFSLGDLLIFFFRLSLKLLNVLMITLFYFFLLLQPHFLLSKNYFPEILNTILGSCLLDL